MKARYFSLLAVAVLLASCAKEALTEKPEITTGKTVLTVGVAPQTMVSMGPADAQGHRQLFWSDGDQIAVNGVTSAALENVEAECTSVDFTFDDPLTTPYNVLYPAGIYTDATHVTLPASQAYKEGGIADGVLPMAGYSADGSSITVSSLCAIVKIQVKRAATSPDEDNLVAVRFQGRNGEQVSGEFTINYQNGTLTSGQYNPAYEVVRSVKNLATSTGAPCVYHVVVPAQTYSQGFDVIVQDVNGHIMTKSKTAPITLEAGHMYTMPEFEFVPTGTELGVEINSAQDLIDFATAYNNKLFDSDLVATLTSDINFDATTSAAFNATGGIGLKANFGDSEDYYFEGLFNGNGHKISGLTATVPIFKATGSVGRINNLTIDNSCTFTFTQGNTGEADFGALVDYHKGTIEGITVNANVALAAASDVTNLTALGGIVGRATTGALKDCVYGGLVSIPAEFAGTAKIFVGGLVAYFSNTGSISGSSFFNGAIDNKAQITSTDKSNPYNIVGGIVGYLNGGATVTGAQATATHADIATAYSNFNGTIVTNTTLAYHSAIGGIVGVLVNGTVSSCTNSAKVAVTVYNGGVDAQGRYIKSGGIAGMNMANGTISNCTNQGTVQHRSNPRIHDLGGIVGYNQGSVSGCTNNAAVNQMTCGVNTKAGRVVSLGGVIGQNAANSTVSDVHNTANIEISSMEDGTGSEVRMGGVIGNNYSAIDGGSGKNITNTGRVYFSPNFTKQFIGYHFGGIVGISTKSVDNAVNSGYVLFRWNSDENIASKVHMGGIVGTFDGEGTISGCENVGGENNAGEVYLNVKSGSAAHTDIYAAGILGYSAGDVSISNCQNSGYVRGGNNTKINGKTCYMGGIVAYLAGNSSIIDCTSTGEIYNSHSNNTDTYLSTPCTGGIAGLVVGTADKHIVIGGTTGCSVNATLGATRGWIAGIAAYALYTDISNSSVIQGINAVCRYAGGVTGNAQFCNIVNCTYNGTALHANNIFGTGIGGIVAQMSDSLIDGCYSYVTALTKTGGNVAGGAIAGICDGSNNTVQNCHYVDEINGVASNIAGTGTFTDGGGNVADL